MTTRVRQGRPLNPIDAAVLLAVAVVGAACMVLKPRWTDQFRVDPETVMGEERVRVVVLFPNLTEAEAQRLTLDAVQVDKRGRTVARLLQVLGEEPALMRVRLGTGLVYDLRRKDRKDVRVLFALLCHVSPYHLFYEGKALSEQGQVVFDAGEWRLAGRLIGVVPQDRTEMPSESVRIELPVVIPQQWVKVRVAAVELPEDVANKIVDHVMLEQRGDPARVLDHGPYDRTTRKKELVIGLRCALHSGLSWVYGGEILKRGRLFQLEQQGYAVPVIVQEILGVYDTTGESGAEASSG